MSNIVCLICCGLDVHRDYLYARIAPAKNGITDYKNHRFSKLLFYIIFPNILRNFKNPKLKNDTTSTCHIGAYA